MFFSLFHPVISQASIRVESGRQTGFTLLELLVVIALMAIVATAATLGYESVQTQGRSDVTQFEMAEIRKALLQFRRDSGSQDFPGQGSYDCTDVSHGGLVTDPNSSFPLTFSVSIAAMSNAEFIAWCQAENNFWMLFIDPFERAEADRWNKDTRRGWNGPYLQNKSSAVSTSGVTSIPSVISPYQSPYLLVDLDTEQAAVVNGGENNALGVITDCNSDDHDDYVVCLLR